MQKRPKDRVLLQPFPGDELDAVAHAKGDDKYRDIPVAAMVSDDNVLLTRFEHLFSAYAHLEQDESGNTDKEDHQRVDAIPKEST